MENLFKFNEESAIEGIADMLAYAYNACSEEGNLVLEKDDDGEAVYSSLPLSEDELDDFLEKYSNDKNWEKPDGIENTIKLAKEESEIFLELFGYTETIFSVAVGFAYYGSRSSSYYCDNEQPELDLDKAYKFWKEELDGPSYDKEFCKILYKISKVFFNFDMVQEEWPSWLTDQEEDE